MQAPQQPATPQRLLQRRSSGAEPPQGSNDVNMTEEAAMEQAHSTPIPDEQPAWVAQVIARASHSAAAAATARLESLINQAVQNAVQQATSSLEQRIAEQQKTLQRQQEQINNIMSQSPQMSNVPTTVPTRAPTQHGTPMAPNPSSAPTNLQGNSTAVAPNLPHQSRSLVLGGFPKATEDDDRIQAATTVLASLRDTGKYFNAPTTGILRSTTIFLTLKPTAPAFVLAQAQEEFRALAEPPAHADKPLWLTTPKSPERLRRNKAVTTARKVLEKQFPQKRVKGCYATGAIEVAGKRVAQATDRCTVEITDSEAIPDAEQFQTDFAAFLNEE